MDGIRDNYISEKMKDLRTNILVTSYLGQEGHIASSFSILDIVWVLYDKVMKNEDKFILSKGHASLALYAVLAEKEFISKEDLTSFCEYDSNLGGHPNRNKVNGVHASTGSLGHGLPIAVGLALAEKINNTSNKIYCVIGDGEANEGTVYESLLLAAHHKLNNFYCIIDNNRSNDRAINLSSRFSSMFSGFGFDIQEITGHNHYDLCEAFLKESDKPNIIICHTIKGNGCKSMENNPAYHHKHPETKEELSQLVKEVES